jgi:hypothetical protein
MALSKIDIENMVTGETPVANGGTGQTTLAAAGLQRPNTKSIVVNGDMAVAQRSTSLASISASGYYTVDRYKFSDDSDAVLTFTQESLTSGNAYLDGFANAFKIDVTTVDSSLGADQHALLSTAIEGQDLQTLKKGTANAETITIAFWVKATKTGTSIFEIYDNDNTRQVSKAFTISTTNTWEKKVLNFPADTTGALDDDNAVSLYFQWYLCAGANYQSGTLSETWTSPTTANRAVGQVNHFDNTSNNFHLTGFQIEVGTFSSTTLPPFQHESYGDNFARCARYFYRVAQHGADGLSNQTVGTGYYKNTDQFRVSVYLPVTPRTNPSLVSGSASNAYVIDIQGATDYVDDFTLTRSNAKIIQVMHNNSDASGTIGEAGEIATDNSSGIIDFNAEL